MSDKAFMTVVAGSTIAIIIVIMIALIVSLVPVTYHVKVMSVGGEVIMDVKSDRRPEWRSGSINVWDVDKQQYVTVSPGSNVMVVEEKR